MKNTVTVSLLFEITLKEYHKSSRQTIHYQPASFEQMFRFDSLMHLKGDSDFQTTYLREK